MKYPLFCFVGISTMALLLITREKEPSAVNNKAESVTRNVFWNNVNNSKMFIEKVTKTVVFGLDKVQERLGTNNQF